MRVRSGDLGKLGDVHVQAGSAEVVALEVTHVEELGGLLGVADDLSTAVSDAAGSVGLACTGGTTLGGSVGAELRGDAAEAIARAAGVERTGVHVGEIPACLGIRGLLRSRLLGTADSAGDGQRHGVLSLAETDRLAELKTVAACKPPGVLVNVLNELLSDTEVLAEGVAAVTRLDLVNETCTILARLGRLVGKSTSRAANPLLGSEGRAEVLGGVVLVEVGGGDLALLGERGTRITRNDLDSLAISAGGEKRLNACETRAELNIASLNGGGSQNTKVDRLLGRLSDADTLAMGPSPHSVLNSLKTIDIVSCVKTDSLSSLVIGIADLESLNTLLKTRSRLAKSVGSTVLLNFTANVNTSDGRARLGKENGSTARSPVVKILGQKTSGSSDIVTRSENSLSKSRGSLHGSLLSTAVTGQRNRALGCSSLDLGDLIPPGLCRARLGNASIQRRALAVIILNIERKQHGQSTPRELLQAVKLRPVGRVVAGDAAGLRTSFGERTRDGVFGLDLADGGHGVHVAGVDIVLGRNKEGKECEKEKSKE